jgi:hypothetical protein
MIEQVLKERGSRYGEFSGHARVSQRLKTIVKEELAVRSKVLPMDQEEALDMIFHKIGRIVNGDCMYSDNYVDIAGYAKLVADTLIAKETPLLRSELQSDKELYNDN